MMAEVSEASAAALEAAAPTAAAASQSDAARRLETEKRELIEKLKKAVGAGKAMKKQLEDARADCALKDEDRQHVVAKLQDVVGRYQTLHQQLVAKDGELQLTTSKVEAFQVELQTQQQQLNDELQKAGVRLAQEEARVLVFQEENNRLTNQVAAMLEDKQQQERETQELVAENHTLQTKVEDLAQQLSGARQQQEDTEQMYLEVASRLNQALRDMDELKKVKQVDSDVDAEATAVRAKELESQIAALEAKADEWKADLAASAEKWELEKLQLSQQIEALTSSNEKAHAELVNAAEIREKLLVHVGIDLSYESIESLLDTKNNEIQMLTEQLAAAEAPQEQAIREAVGAALAEAEGLRNQLEALQGQHDVLATEKVAADKTVEELRAELERVAEEHSTSLSAKEDEHRLAYASLKEKQAGYVTQLEDTQMQKHQLSEDFSTVKSKIEALVVALQIGTPESVSDDAEDTHNSRMMELESYLEHIQEQLVGAAKSGLKHLQSDVDDLQERIRTYETENQQLTAKLEECETELKARASEIEKLAVRRMSDTDQCASSSEDAESCNGVVSDLERELEATKAHLHAVEAEMAACKAENLRMIFEVAKTADGVSRLKQDHETLLETHQKKLLELDAMIEQLKSLQSANQTLEVDLKSKSDDLRCHLETFAMQKEDFQSVVTNLSTAVDKAEKEKNKIKRDLEDIKNENDVLEERISELHAVADSKTEPDEWQEKDREVEELRSSLVQAKVNFLEQKHQLTALEKKLVEVSKSSGPACTINNASLDAERREFEAALIEMIEMEKKLQVAYEAKQNLESTLQERLEAKTELENRLSVAEDKIAELEQQLEQKVALIATIEEQLRSAEEEREKLADEFAKTKSKLERSRGKLEEKAIEFEAFKTTTNMLKDERSRLFNEIALLKDKIAKSEVQKAAMADSQELANEELEEQLNELADRIAEIEAEKQDLRARLEDTIYRSEEDIHQLRERLYMLEEEKSGLDDENFKLERTIESLEAKLDSLEGQKADLETANASTSEQLTLLEDRVEKTTCEIATLSAEKNNLAELQQSLEENVSSLQNEKTNLEQTLEETTGKLRNKLEQVTAQVEALQAQLSQSAAEKDEVSAALSELQERARTDKSAREEVAAKLESQVAENGILENKIAVLKQMAEKALQSLQASRDELSEAESRAAVLIEERDTVKALLHEKESASEASAVQRENLQKQVDMLTSELKDLQQAHSEEIGAAEEVITGLKDAEAKLVESLESAKRDLAEAESCVMVLVEERDAARKDLAAKDLKIEMLTSQQGELDLAAQKFETELNALRNKTSSEAEAAMETIRNLEESKTQAEVTARNLNDLSAQAEEELQVIRDQLAGSELRVAALEKERDATRSSLKEKASTQEVLSALQEDLQNKVDALETELKELRETSAAELAAANETIANLKEVEAEEAEALASLRQELAEAEGCVMVLVEERDATKKKLSKRDLTLEVLSSEHGELQLKSQSVATELEALRNKSSADAHTAEETVQALKEDMKRVTEVLETAQTELAQSESRVASLSAEHDTLSTALSDLDAERESLSTQKEKLLQRIESLETLQTQHLTELADAEETIISLKTSEADIKESLEAIRQELSNYQTRVTALTEECGEARDLLADREEHINTFQTETEILQKHIQTLESELQELQSQREAETQSSEETIRSLKESEAQTAETLEAIRLKLSETEARVVSAEEEREAASKALIEMECHREAQGTEVVDLQERIQTFERELQELQSQREAETQSSEETIRSLKESEAQTAETLESIRLKLSETEARVVSVEEERETASKALIEMECHRVAQGTEVVDLQVRIQTMESELQELQSQREAETQSSEETIRSLKESEAQTAETLEAIRLKLSETEARVLSAEEERDTVLEQKNLVVRELNEEKATLSTEIATHVAMIGDLESKMEADSLELSEAGKQIATLQCRVSELEVQLREQVEDVEAILAKEIEALKKQVATLSESSSSALAEVTLLREQKMVEEESSATSIAQKDDVISTLKSKLEEVMTAYKRLKGHLQDLQERLTQQTTANDNLKTSYNELNAQYSASVTELDALQKELAVSREQGDVLAEKLSQAGEKLLEADAQRENQMENFKKRVLAYDDERAQIQKQHDVDLLEQKETLLAESAARDEVAKVKLSELEQSLIALTETVEKKELELQTATERVRLLKEEHAQAGSVREETNRKHEAECMELEAQLSTANETIEKLRSTSDASVGLQRETISQLENHIAKLKLQIEAETEGANAARAALETYKKRAHSALKKASSENKLNLKKAAQNTTKLEQEVVTAKSRISSLEAELEETHKRMADIESTNEAMVQSAREALESEKRTKEASLRLEIDALKAEVARLEEASESERIPLEAQIKHLMERNEALNLEIATLRDNVRMQNESMEEAVQVKEGEITELSKQLQAALAAAASLASNEAGRRSYSPASSPTEKERRSTASSSRSLFESEGNNSFLYQTTVDEQHEHIAAAVADSCPIPLPSKMISSNGTNGVTQTSTSDDEVVRLKLQLSELETRSHLFHKKYEDTSALLQEANRQKQRLQELSESSTQAINIEYLKNVIMKYIESQVPSEKEQLVPVIATLLGFSPQEHQKVMAVHSKANEEGTGLFGGVFSLFGGGAAAAPPPKPIAAPHNFKPSPTTAKGNTTGAALGSKDKNGVLSFGSEPSDDEEFATPLNPFAA
ncbi:hypothetical protein PF008_g6291 [Phytophthora fragariae]|uniref:GRIP domain-containing protein n=1 Tax=Phytophthora fragariae TaxID=53985 RepID=A0A6G0S7H4_9STRA|nr:hypothetical protein PF008_g6291 [Phytophthora fragariae]